VHLYYIIKLRLKKSYILTKNINLAYITDDLCKGRISANTYR
jgi:hypothetical protein